MSLESDPRPGSSHLCVSVHGPQGIRLGMQWEYGGWGGVQKRREAAALKHIKNKEPKKRFFSYEYI